MGSQCNIQGEQDAAYSQITMNNVVYSTFASLYSQSSCFVPSLYRYRATDNT